MIHRITPPEAYQSRDMNTSTNGQDYAKEYQKYKELCKSVGKTPRTWREWYYCTYSAFEESWRLSH